MWAVLSHLLSFTFHDDDNDDHDVHDNDHNHHEDNIYYNEGGRCCNPVVQFSLHYDREDSEYVAKVWGLC